ncbi:MAG: spore germination protein [Clostridiales bacterium]|nr:spore germination protein [Clostridiales bacterium]
MNKEKNELLTASQLTSALIGFVIGPGLLKLPTLLVTIAYQDAWISALIALMYPLYIVLVSSYIAKKNPNDNILNINRKYLGKVLGSILSGIFGLQFFIYIGTILSEFDAMARIYIVGFLSSIKIIVFCLAIAAIAASKGLKVLSKTSEVITYLIVLGILFTLFIFNEGSLGNFKPVFEAGILNIVKASKDAIYFYSGFEALILIHPFVRRSVNIKKASLKAFLFCTIIWIWVITSTIMYLGVDIIPKSRWSFFLVYDSINFPVINNVRYVFMFVWTLVLLRLISSFIFLSHSAINNFTKIKITKIYYVTLPLLAFFTYILKDSLMRTKLLDIIYPIFACFNVIFLSIILLMVKYRKKSMAKG